MPPSGGPRWMPHVAMSPEWCGAASRSPWPTSTSSSAGSPKRTESTGAPSVSIRKRGATPDGRKRNRDGGCSCCWARTIPVPLRLFDLAARGQASAGDRRTAALTRLLSGGARRMAGDTAASRTTLLAALDTLDALGDIPGQVAALVELGALAEGRGAPLEAESLYRHGLGRLGTGWCRISNGGSSLVSAGRCALRARCHRRPSSLTPPREGRWEAIASRVPPGGAPGRIPGGQVGGIRCARLGGAGARTRRRNLRGQRAHARTPDARPPWRAGGVASRNPAPAHREQDLRRRIAELTEEIAGGLAQRRGPARAPRPRGGRWRLPARRSMQTQKTYATLLDRDAEIRSGLHRHGRR